MMGIIQQKVMPHMGVNRNHPKEMRHKPKYFRFIDSGNQSEAR